MGRQALPVFPSPHSLSLCHANRRVMGQSAGGRRGLDYSARLISLAAPIAHCEPMDTHPQETSSITVASSAAVLSSTTTDIPRYTNQDSTKHNYLHKHLAPSDLLTKRIHRAIPSVGISRRKRPSPAPAPVHACFAHSHHPLS